MVNARTVVSEVTLGVDLVGGSRVKKEKVSTASGSDARCWRWVLAGDLR